MRRRAIDRLAESRRDWVLDSGTGPGVSSRMMLEVGFERVIGLDPSLTLLRSTKNRFGCRFFPVLGVAENLPFRNESVAGVIACYSLRDVRVRTSSISEFARVVKGEGLLEIVDVGKPDNSVLRQIVGFYVVQIMPIIARFFIGRRGRGNPFRMIIPTFHQLPTNRSLTRLTEKEFGPSTLDEFLFGGLIIIEARARVHVPSKLD